MNQDSLTTSPELPKPQREAQPVKEMRPEGLATPEKAEALPPKAERLSAANSAVSQAAATDQPQDSTASTQDDKQLTQTDTNQQPSDSLIADDVDVIEKVWVQKAKSIVNETKDDPHKQSTGLSRLKHDYQNKRFKKDKKLSNS